MGTRARLRYRTMQRLQVLDSRESANEHKTCQQPWEVSRMSTERLIRPVFAFYRGSRCGEARELDHLPERPFGTNPLLVIASCYSVPLRENANDIALFIFHLIFILMFISLWLKIRRDRNNAYSYFANNNNSPIVNMYCFVSAQIYVNNCSFAPAIFKYRELCAIR